MLSIYRVAIFMILYSKGPMMTTEVPHQEVQDVIKSALFSH